MDNASNKGLYTLIAIVVFGIFLSLSYWLFQDQMKNVLADVMFKTSIATSHQQVAAEYYNKNLVIGGDKVVEGPLVGVSYGGVPNTDGVDGHEFIQYMDIAPIFDKFGVGIYTISFDLKTSPKTGPVRVYLQNGASSKYNLWATVDSTTDWKRYSVVVDIKKTEGIFYDPNKAILAFYGTYNTQVSPSVRNVKIQMGTAEGITVYEESPSSLIY